MNPRSFLFMSSIRKLKNDINYLTYDLINECFTYKQFHPEVDNKKVDEAIKEIVRQRNELIFKVNHPDANNDPKKTKTHFNKIREDLSKLEKIVEKLGK